MDMKNSKVATTQQYLTKSGFFLAYFSTLKMSEKKCCFKSGFSVLFFSFRPSSGRDEIMPRTVAAVSGMKNIP